MSVSNHVCVKLYDKIIRCWYNLEKSTRVKAFRCGEFDGCIKKAESSKNLTYTKSLKYAHREDAILHALELEKQDQEKQERPAPGTVN